MTRATKAWGYLLALSAGSTALAASGLAGPVLPLAVLALAGAKAHVILADYLGLTTAPDWRRGFDFGLFLLILAFALLALLG